MNTVINIRASVFPNKGVSLSFEQRIQVSLDCSICGRTHRTVVFRLPGKPGVCTPTGHVFPGNVSPLSVIDKSGLFGHEVECYFLLTYEYSPVAERKYPQHISSSLPTWARVHFKATCPRCQAVSDCSMQNNLVRPWTCVCNCGYPLYKETKEFPTFVDEVADG